ncbi:MAG: LacI family DNA-binding transcriptional regulator [Acidobacteriota bacterium]
MPSKKPEIELVTQAGRTPVNLKQLATHLNLSPTTLSWVLNDSPSATSIPQQTKDRIHAAAREFNYRPNFLARSFRAQKTHTLGVIVPELSDGYSAMVLSGVEEALLEAGYFYFLASHRHRENLLDVYPQMFVDRRVEGIIAVDTNAELPIDLPVVSVSGRNPRGAANILLNHDHAASIALDHLIELGHTEIAFIKGQDFSSDTEVRWNAIWSAADQRGIRIRNELVSQLKGDIPSPELGFMATQEILAKSSDFTAIFAFNDISAIGAIKALEAAGLSVPDDVSVLGFDDVYAAAFHKPALTTIRQPLFEMGRLAAETLLNVVGRGIPAAEPKIHMVEPKLIVRDSTAPKPAQPR